MDITINKNGISVNDSLVKFPERDVDLDDVGFIKYFVDQYTTDSNNILINASINILNQDQLILIKISSEKKFTETSHLYINDTQKRIRICDGVEINEPGIYGFYFDGSCLKLQGINNSAYYTKNEIKQGDVIAEALKNVSTDKLNEIFNRVSTNYEMIRGGNNAIGVLINGKLYTATGERGYNQWASGLGPDARISPYSLQNAQAINIPETAKVVDFGLSTGVSFALLENGHLYTWGQNKSGQCGLGHYNSVSYPTLAATDVVEVYFDQSQNDYRSEYSRLFIKKSNGYIYVSGYNGYGQCGTGDYSNKPSFTRLAAFTANSVKHVYNIGSYTGYTVVITDDNRIFVCGYNGYGQLGTGNNNSKEPSFIDVTKKWKSSDDIVVDIKATSHSYPVMFMLIQNPTTKETILKACGYNGYGQLGIGNTSTQTNPVSINLGDNITIRKIAIAGGYATSVYALTTKNVLYSWGYNAYGQLGQTNNSNYTRPDIAETDVDDILLSDIFEYTYPYYAYIFIRKTDGKLYSCGYNGHGELGVGDLKNRNKFSKVKIPEDEFVTKMCYGYSYRGEASIVAVTDKNNLYCWGSNNRFLLFYNKPQSILVPKKINITTI